MPTAVPPRLRGPLAPVAGAFTAVPERKFLAWALGGALVIRLVFLAYAARLGFGLLAWDEISVARNLAEGRGYTFDYYSMFGSQSVVTAFFPPAYVLNVWALLVVFHSIVAVAVENALLSFAVVWAVWALARRAFGDLEARVALVLAALYPPFFTRITHGNGLYFKMLLVVLVADGMLRLWARPRARTVAVTGLGAGVLVLAMPDALLFVLLFVLAAAAAALMPRGRHVFGHALAVLGVTLLVLAPWTLRNASVFHRFCLASTNGGFNLYMGNHPGATQEMDFDSITQLDRRLGGELARADEVERDHVLVRESIAFVRAHPGEAVRNGLERAWLHWTFRPGNTAALATGGGGEPGAGSGVYRLYLWSYVVSYVVLLAFALAGIVARWRRRADFVPLWLAFLYSTLVAALFFVQTKMRLTKVEPLLVPFAAAGLLGLLGVRNGAARGRERAAR